jgi:hypothetical protein
MENSSGKPRALVETHDSRLESAVPRPAHGRQFLGRRTVLVAISLLIATDAWYWTVRSSTHTPLLPSVCIVAVQGGRIYHPAIPTAIVVEQNGTLRVLGNDDDEAERVRTNPQPGEHRIADVMSIPRVRTIGLLAPVIANYDHTMHWTSLGTQMTPAQVATVRGLYSSYLKSTWHRAGSWNQKHAALLATGDGLTREVLWPGVVHDAVAILVIGAWVWSLRLCTGRHRRQRKEATRQSCIKAGKCPRCGYDIRGLPAMAVCPECSEGFDSHAC